jgi:hypothetical protein
VAAGLQSDAIAGRQDTTDTAGRSTAATIVTPLRRGWATWLRVLFVGARHLDAVTAPMRKLSFIHFIQWTVLDHLPGPSGRTRLPAPVMYFESNFDGDLDQYVDTFAHAVPWRMRMVWSGGLGYPGLFPIEGYKQWSVERVYPTSHYYCAYPDATVTTVVHALAVSRRFDAFLDETRRLDPPAFAVAWRRFLGAVANKL